MSFTGVLIVPVCFSLRQYVYSGIPSLVCRENVRGSGGIATGMGALRSAISDSQVTKSTLYRVSEGCKLNIIFSTPPLSAFIHDRDSCDAPVGGHPLHFCLY